MKSKTYGIGFKDVSIKGYRNINELFSQCDQLHACETLFGDFDAKVMVLAQDTANFKKLKLLHKENPRRNPFRHGEDVKTNINLFGLLEFQKMFDLGEFKRPNNRKCGVYYANAIWWLKDSEDMSGAITNKKEVYRECKKVFEVTIQNLEKLQLIVTMGKEAFSFIKNCFPEEIKGKWPEVVINGELSHFEFGGKRYFVGPIYHPSDRGLIGRSRKGKNYGVSSFSRGFDLTCKDLHLIFNKAELC